MNEQIGVHMKNLERSITRFLQAVFCKPTYRSIEFSSEWVGTEPPVNRMYVRKMDMRNGKLSMQ